MKPSRRRLLVLLLLAAGLLTLTLLPFLSRRTLETRLTAAMGRPASVGGLRYRLAPLGIEITDLRIAGPTPEAPPLLEVPLAEVVPSLPALWSRQIALARLRLVGPRMRVHFFGDGTNDLPVPASGAGTAGVAIRRLVIEAGELELNHDRVPLQLDLPDVSGRMARHAGSLAGTLSFGPGRAQFGAAPPLDASLELELALQPKGVEIQRLRLRTPGTALAGKGR